MRYFLARLLAPEQVVAESATAGLQMAAMAGDVGIGRHSATEQMHPGQAALTRLPVQQSSVGGCAFRPQADRVIAAGYLSLTAIPDV